VTQLRIFTRSQEQDDSEGWITATRWLFGDQIGLLVFLASICAFGLIWRTDIFITDTYALANALYNFSNGQLFLVDAAYGPQVETIGVRQAPGGHIARNYGAIILSLPIWVLLEGLILVTDLRITLIGGYSLALLAFGVQLGRLRASDRIVFAACLGTLLFFIVNVGLATPLDATQTHLYALQLLHICVAAFAPVMLYRLLTRLGSPPEAIAGAGLLVFGTPLAIWAAVPKRHVLIGTAVLVIAYTLYRSRADHQGTPGGVTNSEVSPVGFRALAYATVGLYAWINAPEALVLLVIVLFVDVPTASNNHPRALAFIGSVFVLSLLPFFITNHVLVGSPMTPPQLPSGGGGTAADTAGGSTGQQLVQVVPPLVWRVVRPFRILVHELIAGGSVLLRDPEGMYAVLIRSGDTTAALGIFGLESTNLSVLESAPPLAGLVGWIGIIWRQRDALSLPERPVSGGTLVSLFAVSAIVVFTLFYANRLQGHAQLTVRYLFVIYPLGTYLLCRLPVVQRTLAEHWRVLAWSAAVTVLIGGQVLAVGIFWTTDSLGEAIQLHGVLSVGTAVPLALWALIGRSDGWFGRLGGILLGSTTALAWLFGLFVAIEYYPLGNAQLLPIVRIVADVLTLV